MAEAAPVVVHPTSWPKPIGARITAMCDRVLRALGPGHSEHVYRNALVIELRKGGFDPVEVERSSVVMYEGQQVGLCRSDIYARHREYKEDVVLEIKVLARDTRFTMIQAQRYRDQLVEVTRWLGTLVFLKDGSNVETNFVQIGCYESDGEDEDEIEDLSTP